MSHHRICLGGKRRNGTRRLAAPQSGLQGASQRLNNVLGFFPCGVGQGIKSAGVDCTRICALSQQQLNDCRTAFASCDDERCRPGAISRLDIVSLVQMMPDGSRYPGHDGQLEKGAQLFMGAIHHP